MAYMIFQQDGLYHYELYQHPLSSNINAKEHTHLQYELLFFTKGDAIVNIQRKKYELSPRTLALIKPGEIHNISLLSDTPYERTVIRFDPVLLSPELGKIAKNLKSIHNIQNSLLCFEISKFPIRYDEISQSLWPLFFKCQINTIIAYLCKEENYQKIASKPDELLTVVLTAIDESLLNIYTLEDVCAITNLSATSLQNLFHEYLGESVMAYIRFKKMFCAKNMLNKGYSPQKVSDILGFDNYSTFYRNYKKTFNESPSGIPFQNTSS